MPLYRSAHINKSSDPVAAQELLLFIQNDGDLYRQQHSPIIKNLVAKKARGVYRSDLATKLFGYLVESGAKKYTKEYGNRDMPWHEMFPKALRENVAKELRDHFEREFALGNYSQMTPKKYQHKTAKRNPLGGSTLLWLGLAAVAAWWWSRREQGQLPPDPA